MGKRFVPCSFLCMYYHVALTSDRSVYDQHFGGWEILVSGGSWHLGYDCSSYLGMECQCREVLTTTMMMMMMMDGWMNGKKR